ncbi:MAG: hypothetical protein AABZ12_00410 [Planctomycetota bacterium]
MNQRVIHVEAPPGFVLKATVLSHGWHECAPMSWSEGGRCFQLIERENDCVFRVSVLKCPSMALSAPKPRSHPAAQNRRLCTAIPIPSPHPHPRKRGRGLRAAAFSSDPLPLRGGDAPCDALRVLVESHALDGRSDDPAIHAIISRLRITLGLDRDFSEFYALCADHPALRVAPTIGAGRLIRSASMTENMLKALCSTNVNWTQAVKMINRLGQLGPIVPHFRNQNAWPTPREILRAGERYLNDICRMGYRSECVLKFCRDVCDGKFDPDSLDAMAADPNAGSDEIVARLRSIRGIGPSSAHSLLGFLGRHDRLSIDSATVAHVRAVHTKGRKPTLKQIERIYAPFGRWKNLVYWLESWLRWSTAKSLVREVGTEAGAGAEVSDSAGTREH